MLNTIIYPITLTELEKQAKNKPSRATKTGPDKDSLVLLMYICLSVIMAFTGLSYMAIEKYNTSLLCYVLALIFVVISKLIRHK